MVIEPKPRHYATPEQLELLKRYAREGTISKRYLTEDLWLTNRQAKELGLDMPEGEDFLLSPLEPEAEQLYGRIPLEIVEREAIPAQTIEPQVVTRDVADLLMNIYPEKFAPEVSWGQTVAEVNSLADQIAQQALNDPDAFIEDIRSRGRNKSTEALLKAVGANDEDIARIFPPETYPKGFKPTTAAERQAFLRREKITPAFEIPYEQIEARANLPSLTWLDKVNQLAKDPTQLIPFVSSGKEIFTLAKLLQSALDLQAGRELSQEDLLALQEYVDRAQQKTDWSYKIADTLANLIPFAGEFMATGGIFAAGKTATIKVATQVLKKLATRSGAKLLEGKLAKFGVQVAGTVAGGTLRTIPAGVTRIPAATLEKQIVATLTGNEESVWKSAVKSLGEQWVEVVSESTGGLFGALTAPVKGQLTKIALFKAFQKVNPLAKADDIQRVFNKLGYDGVLDEMLEERVADVGHGILFELGLGNQKFQIPSLEQLSVELVSFSVPGVTQRLLTTAPVMELLTGERGGVGGVRPPAEWNKMSVPDRVKLVQSAGLEGKIGSKAWGALTQAEKQAISTQIRAPAVTPTAPAVAISKAEVVPAVTLPKAEVGEPEAVAPKFATNIRLEKYSEEVRPIITEWAETHPEQVHEARRGIIPDEKVRAEAERLTQEVGGDLDKMRKRWKPGTAWNAEELVAIRGVLQEKTKAVIKAQEVARKSNSTENLLKLQIALQEQATVQEQVHGLTAEAGRALRSFRQNALDAIKSRDIARMEEVLKQIGGRENTEKIAQLLSQIDINDPIAVNKFIQSLYKPNVMDYLTELFYNSILSGPKTHIVNSLSNTANVLFSPVERMVSALVDMPLAQIQGRAQERYLDEVPADIFGAVRGIPEGFRQFAYIVKNGISFDQATKWEFRPKAFKGKVGAVIGMPSRFLEAADALMKCINQRAAINAEAHRIAKIEGLKAQAFEDKVAELLSNPTAEMLSEANKVAEYRLFRQEPGKFGKTLMNLREAVDIKGIKPLRFVIPFIRTPLNLVKYGLERTPLGFVNPKLWENVAQKNPEAADQIARAMIGSVGLAALSFYAAAGMITGAPPRDRAERERFYREGKQPFAIRVDGFWVSYQRLEPFNQLLGLVAIVGDMIRNNDKGVDEKIVDAVNTFGQNFISQTYMRGFSDLINMLSSPERYAGNWLNRFASAFVIPMSAATRTVAQMLDNTVKDPANAWEVIESNIPGLSKNVKAKLTALGEDIERKSPAWFPVSITPVETTLLSQELERLKYDIGFVGKTISGIELTKDEQYEYQKLSGQLIKQDLEKLMLAPEYWTTTDIDRNKMIQKVADSARDWARMKMREKMWTIGATEERMKVLETALAEIDSQLGKVISATPEFTHEEPNVYDLPGEMDNSYRSLLGDIPEEALKGIKVPETVKSWYKTNRIIKETSSMPDKALISLSAREGTTFEDYYTQWQQRSKITDERELAEFDKEYKNANLGNISKRQLEMLREYHKTPVSKQAGFLANLTEDERNSILNNSYKDWIESHPKENAELAIWGKAKLSTKESYEEFIELVKQLDVPNSALPKNIIPENLDAFMIETEKVYREINKKFEATQYLDDTIKVENGLTARDKARAELRATKVGKETFGDTERRVDAMGKGTRENPIPQDVVDAHVTYMRILDQKDTKFEGAEANLFRIDNDAYNKSRLDKDIWVTDAFTEDVDRTQEAKWRLQVKNRDKYVQYEDTIPAKYKGMTDVEVNALPAPEGVNPSWWAMQRPDKKRDMMAELDRTNMKAGDAQFRKDRLTIEAYEKYVPVNLIETYVAFNELPEKGQRRKRMLVNEDGTPTEFGQKVWHDIMGNDIPKLEDIHSVGWDETYEANKDALDKLLALDDIDSIYYIEDADERDKARNALRYDAQGNPTDLRLAELRLDAYEARSPTGERIPEVHIDRYVAYAVIPEKGYRKEHFLMENEDYYQSVYLDMLKRSPIDFSKIPDVRYDDLYDEFKEQFDEWDSYADETSPNFIQDEEQRTYVREGLLARDSDFRKARWGRNAYLDLIGQEQFVSNYVDFREIEYAGKPPGTDFWFDDDWYLMEHPEFYKAMTDLYVKTKGKQGWKPGERDFSKVPPKDVYQEYLVYDAIIGSEEMGRRTARLKYRRTHPRLDAWLFLIGAVTKTIEQYDVEAGMTSAELIGLSLSAKGAEIDRLLMEIQRKLAAMR